ncbi:MAG TPA: succinate dehydrogenase, hydrophobic membrane anchor protein [Candidatus Binatia bacterium]|nr:succinate dehydrogenase, hydrophobic membrane anchor protein [Candidatus Binatia bacterium]
MNSLRSPLARARGLGSAKTGVHHFWVQRVSAVALIPLALWLLFGQARLTGGSFASAKHWIASPSVAVTLVLTLAALFYHSALGVQVVIEDYVAGEGRKLVTLLLSKFAHAAAAAAGIFAVLRIAFGA